MEPSKFRILKSPLDTEPDLRAFLNLAYQLRRRLWRVIRPRTTGVKVMVFNDPGELLLVRNSYGATHHFVLPGGGVRPWEELHSAAEREIREEVALSLSSLTFVASYLASAEGKRDTVHLFKARTSQAAAADRFEIAEARFFALDSLPETLSPATARRIAEHLGERDVDGRW